MKLNPLRISKLSATQRLHLNTAIQKHRKVTERHQKKSSTNAVQKKDPTQECNAPENNQRVFSSNHVNSSGVKQIEEHFNSVFDDDTNKKGYSKEMPIEEPSCSSQKPCNSYESPPQTPKKSNILEEKSPSKMSTRTKYLLTSFLKFKRTLRAKRRNSSSCSDLFVI